MHFLKAVWIFIFIFCLQGAAFVLSVFVVVLRLIQGWGKSVCRR